MIGEAAEVGAAQGNGAAVGFDAAGVDVAVDSRMPDTARAAATAQAAAIRRREPEIMPGGQRK